MRNYTYGILECENAGDITNHNIWRINYPDSEEFVLVHKFPMTKINLLVAISEAEKLGWELVQIFPDSSTGYISYGYAVMRKEYLDSPER